MLQTPINVYPSNGEVVYIDKTKDENGEYTNPMRPSFTFQGDLLSFLEGETYDLDTNDLVCRYYAPKDGTMSDFYNGDKVSMIGTAETDKLINGRNYKYKLRLYQQYPKGMPLEGQPLADMYFGRGKIYDNTKKLTLTSKQVLIAPGLTNMRNAYYYEPDGHLIGAIYMEIGHERRMIETYDRDSGIVTLNAAFSPKPEVGTAYKLFTNYLETGFYDFKTRARPDIGANVITESDGLKAQLLDLRHGIVCQGRYSQEQNIGLKWYNYKVFTVPFSYRDPLDDPLQYGGKLIEESARLYSYNLSSSFPINPCTNTHVVQLNVATQDDDTQLIRAIVPRISGDNPDKQGETCVLSNVIVNSMPVKIDDDNNKVLTSDSHIKLEWNANKKEYIYDIFRSDIREDGSIDGNPVYLGCVGGNESAYEPYEKFYDYTVENNHTYRYEIVVKSGYSSEYGKPLAVHYIYNVSTKWQGWRIFSLLPQDDRCNRHFFTVKDEWAFIAAIDSGSITHNIHSTLHVGTSGYPKTSRDSHVYESGTFTADLLKVSCPNNQLIDNIEQVKAWTRFISGNNSFLLKSAKGDAWVVNIVNSPTRKYEETWDPIFTNITYEWVECLDVTKCVFI